MSAKSLTAAFEKTVVALLPLAPEDRRRVIEAVHALIEIGEGTGQRRDEARGRGPAPRPRKRR